MQTSKNAMDFLLLFAQGLSLGGSSDIPSTTQGVNPELQSSIKGHHKHDRNSLQAWLKCHQALHVNIGLAPKRMVFDLVETRAATDTVIIINAPKCLLNFVPDYFQSFWRQIIAGNLTLVMLKWSAEHKPGRNHSVLEHAPTMPLSLPAFRRCEP